MSVIPRTLPRPTYALDVVNGQQVVVMAEPIRGGQISIVLWSLDCARAILSDKQRIAAEYEAEGDIADRQGRSDGLIFRAMASNLLTQAADLFELLNGVADERRAA